MFSLSPDNSRLSPYSQATTVGGTPPITPFREVKELDCDQAERLQEILTSRIELPHCIQKTTIAFSLDVFIQHLKNRGYTPRLIGGAAQKVATDTPY